MGRRNSFASGEYYHLYNRGVEKRQIFIDDKDRERFIRLLYFCNSENGVDFRSCKGLTFAEARDKRGESLIDIGAYCLMPNHFHLLVKEKREGGISLFMQKLLTAYTMYFNVKAERKGRLFESSFYSTHASEDRYLKYLFSYIHMNPLKLIDHHWKEKGIYKEEWAMRSLDDYSYSSYMEYKGIQRDQAHILNRSEFPDYFINPKDFIDELASWFTEV